MGRPLSRSVAAQEAWEDVHGRPSALHIPIVVTIHVLVVVFKMHVRSFLRVRFQCL